MSTIRTILVTVAIAATVAAAFSPAAFAQSDDADEAVRQAAREHYLRGQDLFQRGRSEEALRELQASFALVPLWATLNGMALCQEDLNRSAEALDLYRRAIAMGGDQIPADQRGQIDDRIRELLRQLRIARLAVESEPPGATVALDGTVMGTTPFDEDVPAGSYRVTVVLEGVGQGERQLTLAPAETRTLEMALVALAPVPVAASGSLRVESDPPGAVVYAAGVRLGTTPLLLPAFPVGETELVVEGPRGGRWVDRVTVTEGADVRVAVDLPGSGLDPVWFWVTAGTAAALGVVGAATGGYGISLHDEYHDASTRAADRVDLRDLGETMFDVADGCFISAGVVAVGALVLGLLTDFGGIAAEGRIEVAPRAPGGSDAAATSMPVW